MLPEISTSATGGQRGLAPRWRFLLVAAGLYLLWQVSYEGYIKPDGRFDAWLATHVAAGGAGLLRLLGFAATAAPGSIVLMMDSQPAVRVGPACDGLVLYVLFSGFILAFPGPLRPKLWFIPAGVLALYLLNIGRVAALALNHHYAHRSVDFNHHYTFTFIVYAFICGLWMLWVRWYGTPAASAE